MDQNSMNNDQDNQLFKVDSFRPSDAQGIVDLFHEVYGNDYPIRIFYDPDELTRANQTGQYLSIVARNTEGKIIGVEHLFRSAPYPRLYEAGAGLILKDYRRLGVNNALLDFIFEQWAPGNETIEEVFGEPVCNHIHMQRVVEKFSYVATALEVALMPAAAYDKEKSALGRVSVLLTTRCYRPKPHSVFIAKAYEEETRFLYSGIKDGRELRVGEERLPDPPTQSHMTIFSFAKVARIAVNRMGADFSSHMANLEAEAIAKDAVVIQVWLNASVPWLGSAVNLLSDKGYFLGGILSRWFDQDGFFMQKVFCDPCFDGIQLHSQRAKDIFQMVKNDWDRIM